MSQSQTELHREAKAAKKLRAKHSKRRAAAKRRLDFSEDEPELPPAKKVSNGKIRFRRFVFTLNNYTEQEYENVKNLDCQWLVVAKETGENGTPHLQGACVIGKQVTLSAIKTWPGYERCHIEVMRGSPQDSLQYCSKQDVNPFTKGEMPQNGKRNDLLSVVQKLRTASHIKELAPDDEFCVAYIKYPKGITLLRDLFQDKRDRAVPPQVVWLHGPSGVGKTRACVELCEEITGLGGYWISLGSLQWFDGYSYEKAVIFDDLRAKHCDFAHLLRLLDRYELRVPFKGGFIQWVPQYIFITTPHTPRDMFYMREEEQLYQLTRRCSIILDCSDGVSAKQLRSLLFPDFKKPEPGLPGTPSNPINLDPLEGEVEDEFQWSDFMIETFKDTENPSLFD